MFIFSEEIHKIVKGSEKNSDINSELDFRDNFRQEFRDDLRSCPKSSLNWPFQAFIPFRGGVGLQTNVNSFLLNF